MKLQLKQRARLEFEDSPECVVDDGAPAVIGKRGPYDADKCEGADACTGSNSLEHTPQSRTSKKLKIWTKKESRNGAVEAGSCVSCPSAVDATTGIALTEQRVIGLLGGNITATDLPKLFFCGENCARKVRGKRTQNAVGQGIIKHLRTFMHQHLGTDTNVGDLVNVIHDFSPNRNVQSGQGRVISISRCGGLTNLTVRYTIGGNVIVVGPTGVRACSELCSPVVRACAATAQTAEKTLKKDNGDTEVEVR